MVLDSGIINPPNLDVYYGSIAVNPLGQAVIGFYGIGTERLSQRLCGCRHARRRQLQFGDPILLKAGVAPYGDLRQFGISVVGWGDYSTTTLRSDQSVPLLDNPRMGVGRSCTGSVWSTEISEIVFAPPAPTVQTWFGGTGNFSDPQNWSPAGSPAATNTLIIDAGRVKADDLTISNPNIRLGSSTTTPTLVLQDSTLAATSSRVETTTFDPSQPDLDAKIRVFSAVTEDGAIEVGTTGVDVNQLFPAHLTISMAKNSTFTMDPAPSGFPATAQRLTSTLRTVPRSSSTTARSRPSAGP